MAWFVKLRLIMLACGELTVEDKQVTTDIFRRARIYQEVMSPNVFWLRFWVLKFCFGGLSSCSADLGQSFPSVDFMFWLLQRVEESGLFLWSVWLIVKSRVKVNCINYREGAAGEISGRWRTKTAYCCMFPLKSGRRWRRHKILFVMPNGSGSSHLLAPTLCCGRVFRS
jgi:hypothetical protein